LKDAAYELRQTKKKKTKNGSFGTSIELGGLIERAEKVQVTKKLEK
jgi:hypothetical protein